MGRLLLLFILVPAAELALLIEIGRRIGTWPTLGLIVGTGMLGAALARRQGIGILRKVRAEMAAGRLPASPLVDGVLVLVAGAMLMTPGILTDSVGLLCLIPVTRRFIKGRLWAWLKRAVEDGRVKVSVTVGGYPGRPPREPTPPPERREQPERLLDS